MTRVEQRLRAAIEAIGEGFALFDEQEKLVLCNETYARLYDRAPGELIGRSMAQMAADYAAANLPESEREAHVVRRLARLRDGDASPLEARTRDGRWLLVTQRRTEDGETVVVRADITELTNRRATPPKPPIGPSRSSSPI